MYLRAGLLARSEDDGLPVKAIYTTGRTDEDGRFIDRLVDLWATGISARGQTAVRVEVARDITQLRDLQ